MISCYSCYLDLVSAVLNFAIPKCLLSIKIYHNLEDCILTLYLPILHSKFFLEISHKDSIIMFNYLCQGVSKQISFLH